MAARISIVVLALVLISCDYSTGDAETWRFSSLTEAFENPNDVRSLNLDGWGIYASSLNHPNDKILDQWPRRLSELPKLRTLTIYYHNISQLPTDLPNWTELTDLNLTGNRIVDISGISKLKSLRHVGLGANLIQTLPAEIFELPNLRTLDVTANPISPQVIDQLQRKYAGRVLLITDNSDVLHKSNLQAFTRQYLQQRNIRDGDVLRMWLRLRHKDNQWLLIATGDADATAKHAQWDAFRYDGSQYKPIGKQLNLPGDQYSIAELQGGGRLLRVFDSDSQMLYQHGVQHDVKLLSRETLTPESEAQKYQELMLEATKPLIERWPVARLLK